MSADLQDPVELINQFLDVYFDSDYQIVAGVRGIKERFCIINFFYQESPFGCLRKLIC